AKKSRLLFKRSTLTAESISPAARCSVTTATGLRLLRASLRRLAGSTEVRRGQVDSVAVADVVLKTAIDVPADQVVRAAPAVQIVDLGRAAVQAVSLTTGSARAGTYIS
ncbi:MAG: hypothetical protein VYE19_02400, partial [Chloroflexota bacterium]|nr:hypothetical protein [Chloroflexota bacterium]MED5568496.1 hypothetical protein [Chloroflexota bacterium]